MALADQFKSAVELEALKLRYSAFHIEEGPDFVRVVASGRGIPTMYVVASNRELRVNHNDDQMTSLASHRVNNAYMTANRGGRYVKG